MHSFAFVFAQHTDRGDLTFLGQVTASAYVVGSLFCARAGLVTHLRARRQSDHPQPWWLLAGILFFLGLNKWLNLQTRLINVGRSAVQAHGWHPYEHGVQAAFVVLFTMVLTAAFAAGFWKWRGFAHDQPLAGVGVLVLFLFVVVRAATLNHVDTLLRLNLHDDYWAWTLELAATACLAWSAARAGPLES